MQPQLSIVIVNYNTSQLLGQCLQSIAEQCRCTAREIIVVDNASSDDSVAMVRRRFPEVRLICNPENVGFGVANNIGVAAAAGEFLLLLNSDAVLLEDTPAVLMEFLKERPEAGAVGPAVVLADGRPQPMIFGNQPNLRTVLNEALFLNRLGAVRFAGIHARGARQRVTRVGWISGVCMLFRKEAYDRIGGFDKTFFLYAEDLEICGRLQAAGWVIYHLDAAAIRHCCGGSSTRPAERYRNSRLQQHNLLILLSRNLSRPQFRLARLLLGVGLILRLGISAVGALSGRRPDRERFHGYRLKLTDLVRASVGVQEGSLAHRH